MADEFPEFAGGDVRIVLTTGRQYQLHASILRNGSPLMRRLLDPAHGATLSSRAVRAGATTRWKLVLVAAPEEGAALQYRLSAVTLSDRGAEFRGSTTNIIVENENGRVEDPIFGAFDSILAALHGLPVSLGDAQEDNMADLLRAALDVLEVADYMECIPIVTGPIEATLLATGQTVYRAIAENPTGWLIFANRVRSRAIFKEALIHTVGMYNTPKVQKMIHDGILPDEVLSIVELKAQGVVNGVSAIMCRLVAYYPRSLKREATVGRIDKDNTGRAAYGNDILGWMALTAFRHWVGSMMATDQTAHAKDMGFAFMKAVFAGGQTYLNRKVMQQNFHRGFPMSAKVMNAVEFRLTEIKENVKGYVKPFFRASCQLDLHRYPVKHYTHINVSPEDFPWHAAMIAARDASIYQAMHFHDGFNAEIGSDESGDSLEFPQAGDGHDEMNGDAENFESRDIDEEELYDVSDYEGNYGGSEQDSNPDDPESDAEEGHYDAREDSTSTQGDSNAQEER